MWVGGQDYSDDGDDAGEGLEEEQTSQALGGLQGKAAEASTALASAALIWACLADPRVRQVWASRCRRKSQLCGPRRVGSDEATRPVIEKEKTSHTAIPETSTKKKDESPKKESQEKEPSKKKKKEKKEAATRKTETSQKGPSAIVQKLPCATVRGGAAAAAAANEHMQQEQYAHAAAKLREAIQLEADPVMSLQSRINLGCTFQRLGSTDRAEETLRDAHNRLRDLWPQAPPEPHPVRAHLTRLQCVIHVNLSCALGGDEQQHEIQRMHLLEALRLDPNCVDALFHLAALLEQEGKLEEALRHIQRGLATNPEELSCLCLGCKCLEVLGRHQEALLMCERICGIDLASTYLSLKQVFRCQGGDVFVVTYPRCGTTWMVQIATCVLHGAQADYDRHAFFVEGSIAQDRAYVRKMESFAAPRIMKMHVPADMHPGLARGSETELQGHGKVIYVVRNPKDALVSLKHHHTNNAAIAFKGDWEEWVTQWLAGDRSKEYGGTYFSHVKKWWRLSRLHPDRVLIVCFEDMKKDLGQVIAAVAQFLDQQVSPAALQQMVNRCTFDTMKGKYKVEDEFRNRVNPIHFRKGEVGSWREILTAEQAARVDAAVQRELGEELAQGLQLKDDPLQ